MSTEISTVYLKLGYYGNTDYGKRVYWFTNADGKVSVPYEYIWCNELAAWQREYPEMHVVILPDVD